MSLTFMYANIRMTGDVNLSSNNDKSNKMGCFNGIVLSVLPKVRGDPGVVVNDFRNVSERLVYKNSF